MPGPELNAVLQLEVNTKDAIANFKAALREISDAIGSGVDLSKLNGQMKILTSSLDRVIYQYKEAADIKDKFQSFSSMKDVAEFNKLNSIIVALVNNLRAADREVKTLYTNSAKIPGARTGVSQANSLMSSQRAYMDYQTRIAGKQAAGQIVSEAELGKLARLRQAFEDAKQSVSDFQGQVHSGSVIVNKDVGEIITTALDRASAASIKLENNFDRVFGNAGRQRIEQFTRGVKMQMDDMSKSVARAMDSVKDAVGSSTVFNTGAVDRARNAVLGQRSTLNSKLKGARSPQEKEVIMSQLSDLDDFEYKLNRDIASQQVRYQKSIDPNYGISPTALRGDIAMNRAKKFISTSATQMREGGAVSLGGNLDNFQSMTDLHLSRIRSYVLEARKEIQQIESGKVDAHPDSLKALRNFVKEAVALQNDMESKTGSMTSRISSAMVQGQRVRGLAAEQLATQFGEPTSRFGKLGRILRGDKAFAGQSASSIQGNIIELEAMMASGDLGPEETAMARALSRAANSRMAAMNRSPFGSTVRSPILQQMFLGSAQFLKRGAYGMMGAFSPYGNEYANSMFHRGNIYTSHISALMGLPLYGMGIAGLGMAGIRGILGLTGQAETQKLTLSGLVNTYMKFNAAGTGKSFDPASNFVMSQRYTEDLYQKIRTKASRSILTTQELLEYFMAGGAKGMSRGLSGEQSLDIVHKMATLGKAMNLRPLDVQQDIRALFSGDVRATNKLGILMGFTGPGIKGAFQKGPDEFLKMFEEKFKGFAAAMEKMPGTLQGSFNMLLNTFQQLGMDIGKIITPIIVPAIKSLGSAIQELRDSGKLNEVAQKIGEVMKKGISWITSLILHFDGFTAALANMLKVFIVYKAVATVAAFTGNLGMAMGAVGALSTAIIAFVAMAIYQRKLLEGQAVDRAENIGNLTGPYRNMTSESKQQAKFTGVSMLTGKDTGLINMFGKDIGATGALRLAGRFSPEVLNDMGAGTGISATLSTLASNPYWQSYKDQYGFSNDKEAMADLAQAVSKGEKRPLKNPENSMFIPTGLDMADLLASANFQQMGDVGASGIRKAYIDIASNMLNEMSKTSNMGSFVGTKQGLEAINDLYSGAFGLSGQKGPAGSFKSFESVRQYLKNAPESPQKKAFVMDLMQYGYGDIGAFTTNPTGDQAKTGKVNKSLKNRWDYLASLQSARVDMLSNYIGKIPDLTMAGGKFVKYGLLETQFSESKNLAGITYQASMAHDQLKGDAFAIKEAQTTYIKSVVDAKDSFFTQTQALKESIAAIKDQTDEIIRGTELMSVQFEAKKAQISLGQTTPGSAGYMAGISNIYTTGKLAIETQYTNNIAGIDAEEAALKRALGSVDLTDAYLASVASGKETFPGIDKKTSMQIAKTMQIAKVKGLDISDAQKGFFAAKRAQAGQSRTEGLFGLGQDRLQMYAPLAADTLERMQTTAGINASIVQAGRGQFGIEKTASIRNAQAEAKLAQFDSDNKYRADNLQKELQTAYASGNPYLIHAAKSRMQNFINERQSLQSNIFDTQYQGSEAVRREQIKNQYAASTAALRLDQEALSNQYNYGSVNEYGLGRFGATNTVQYQYEAARGEIQQMALKRKALLESDYGKYVLGIHPDMVTTNVNEYVAQKEQALSMQFQPQFAAGRMSDLKFGAISSFGMGAYASPMSLTSLSGISGLAATALGGAGQYGGQKLEDALRFMYNPKDVKLREAFMKGIPAKYQGDPYGYARNYALASIGGGIAGSWLGRVVGGSSQSVATGQAIGGGLAALGAFANILPGIPGGGALFGAVAGGLLGGLFGRRGHHIDPREEAHRKRVEELLSRIDKSLRPQNDYFRTVNRDVLFGSASRFLSGRFSEDLAAGQSV